MDPPGREKVGMLESGFLRKREVRSGFRWLEVFAIAEGRHV